MHWYELEVWKRTCFPDSELTYFLLIPPQIPVFCTWHLLNWIDSTFWIFLGLCVSNVFGCSLSAISLNTPVCQSYSLKPFHVCGLDTSGSESSESFYFLMESGGDYMWGCWEHENKSGWLTSPNFSTTSPMSRESPHPGQIARICLELSQF